MAGCAAGVLMHRRFRVLIADQCLADSELMAQSMSSMSPEVSAEALRPGDLGGVDLQQVDLLLLDVDVNEDVFLDVCDRALRIGLLYAGNSRALHKRARYKKVKVVVSRAASSTDAQKIVLGALRGREELQLPQPREGHRLPPLSRRETEVLRLVAQGLPNHHIAAQLSISTHTVRTHVQSLLAKFDRGSRVAAVGAARQAGLL